MAAYLDTVGVGDSVEYLKQIPDNSIDSCVCDPPYGLGNAPDPIKVMTAWVQGKTINVKGGGFMMKEWDSFVPQPDLWKEVFRVLKPGAYLLAFFGGRTYDWGTMAIRFAGFEVVDQLEWIYGTGFPKSLSLSKAIDAQLTCGRSDSVGLKKANDEVRTGEGRERRTTTNNGIMGEATEGRTIRDEPATPEGARWDGWGTALKPGHEPVVCARKPLTPVPLITIVQEVTNLVEALLWSMSSAKCVELVSTSNQNACVEAESCSVRWLVAVLNTVECVEERDLMATFRSPEAGSTFLSIATSWNNTLAALYGRMSTFTTKTATRLTTALRIWKSSLMASTPADITQVALLQNGLWSSAPDAKDESKDGRMTWLGVPNPSAPNSVTWQTANAVLGTLAAIASDDSLPLKVTIGSSAPSAVITLQKEADDGHEPIVVARKPFDGTFAENVLEHGTGAMNIDASRVSTTDSSRGGGEKKQQPRAVDGWNRPWMDDPAAQEKLAKTVRGNVQRAEEFGRWPPNVLFTHSLECEHVGSKAIRNTGHHPASRGKGGISTSGHVGQQDLDERRIRTEKVADWRCVPGCPVAELGAESRFFPKFRYQSKPSRAERESGLDEFPLKSAKKFNEGGIQGRRDAKAEKAIAEAEIHSQGLAASGRTLIREDGTKTLVERFIPQHRANIHPTVKPVDLMRWLVRLVTQPGGIVLDPFMGSGTTGMAAVLEGFHFVGIEKDAEYAKIANARIKEAGITVGTSLHSGAFLCPGCKAKGRIKLISNEAVQRMMASGKKTTCMKCMKRYTYDELVTNAG